ncbi:MAG: hypothetical protein SGBAC_004834 [Bacillariaceae sp.]
MPPFSGEQIDRYTSIDDVTPPSPSVSQTIFRTVRRSLFFDDFEPCPGAQPLIEEIPRKRVTFNLDLNESHEILHARDYSAPERALTWFSIQELQQIKSDSRLIVQASLSGAQGYYTRGLEAKKNEAYRLKRKQNKADVRFAVMNEQSTQKFVSGGGELDHMRIGMVSRDCSRLSQFEAQQVGKADEQAAISAVMEMCSEEEKAELMGYDCTSLFLLAQSAYAY